MSDKYTRSFSAMPVRREFSKLMSRSFVELPKRRIFYTLPRAAKIPAELLPQKPQLKKGILALLIAAHNEELVIGDTINSAIVAGMKPENIYIVDDGSVDNTSKIAKSLIPSKNVLKTSQGGKGAALSKGAKRFKLTSRYRWIHIADADGAFSPRYFKIFRRELRTENAAATGYIRSLPGKRISEYRVFEYTIGMEIHRRVQALLNVVPVIPGPTACFRADVFGKLNFDNKSLTEDFDVTMQLHRLKLGKVQYIPKAIAYTQDPETLKDYTHQIARWNRGGLQSIIKYRMGRQLSLIDAYLSYTILQNLMFFLIYLVWVPYVTIIHSRPGAIATAFVVDVMVTFVITLLAATRSMRLDVISAFPFIYVLRWVSLGVFLKSFFEVVVLKKYRDTNGIWGERSTRYRWNVN